MLDELKRQLKAGKFTGNGDQAVVMGMELPAQGRHGRRDGYGLAAHMVTSHEMLSVV